MNAGGTTKRTEPQWLVLLVGLLITGLLTSPTILAFEANPLYGAALGILLLVVAGFVRASHEARAIRMLLWVLGSAYCVLGLAWWAVGLIAG